MKKTLLVLTGLIFIAACSAGGRSGMMGTGAASPLADKVCDQTALASKVAVTSNLVAQPLFYFVADLQDQYPECSQAEIVNVLVARFVGADLVGSLVQCCRLCRLQDCQPRTMSIGWRTMYSA